MICISSERLHFHKINIGRCRSSWYLCRAADGDGNALPLAASLLFECDAVHYADGDGVALDVCREALTTHIQGYPIPMCVMNRIAFEQQRDIEG